MQFKKGAVLVTGPSVSDTGPSVPLTDPLSNEIPWCFEGFQLFFSVLLGFLLGSRRGKNPWCFGWFSLVFRVVFLGLYLNTKERKIRAGPQITTAIVWEKKAYKHKLFALVNVQMALGQTAGCPRVNRAKKFMCSPRNTGNINFSLWFTGRWSKGCPDPQKAYVFKVYVPFSCPRWKSQQQAGRSQVSSTSLSRPPPPLTSSLITRQQLLLQKAELSQLTGGGGQYQRCSLRICLDSSCTFFLSNDSN